MENLDITDLADRSNDGINVVLWLVKSVPERLFVTVDDAKHGANYEFDVPSPDKAMDAFMHPFSYLGDLALAAA